MKKFFIIIILTLPLLWEDVQAQSTVTASQEETFFEDFGQKLLIRANPNDNNNPLIYYVTASNIGRKWYFLYHSIHTVIPKVEPKSFSTSSNNIVGTQTRRFTSCNIITEQ